MRAFETPRTVNFFFNCFKSDQYYLHFERIFEGIATPITGGPQFCVRWVALPGLPRYQIEALWGEKGSGDAHPYLSLFCVLIKLEFCGDFGENVGELGFFFFGEFAKDEVDVTEFFAEGIVPCAEAESGEVFRAEVGDDGFEAIVAASGAVLSFAELAEF